MTYEGSDSHTLGPNGPFTILVDNTHAGCADSGGSEEMPRCSIPTNIAAGQVVEVRGGPYTLTTQTTLRAPSTRSTKRRSVSR